MAKNKKTWRQKFKKKYSLRCESKGVGIKDIRKNFLGQKERKKWDESLGKKQTQNKSPISTEAMLEQM